MMKTKKKLLYIHDDIGNDNVIANIVIFGNFLCVYFLTHYLLIFYQVQVQYSVKSRSDQQTNLETSVTTSYRNIKIILSGKYM